MPIPMSEGTLCGSMCSWNQCQVPSCLQQWCQLWPMESYIWGPLRYPSVCTTQVPIPLKSPQRLWLARSCLPTKCHWWSSQQGPQECNRNPQKGWVLEALDLQGLREWLKPEQEQTRELLLKWEHLFAHSDLDLDKTALIKHKIQVTDRIPFKEHYWCIPPHMYNNVRAHLQEILVPSESCTVHGLAQWSLSGRRMAALGSVLTSGSWITRPSRMHICYLI